MTEHPGTPAGTPGSGTTREDAGHRASVFGIAVNTALFALKFIAGVLSGSVSLRGDAFNNLSDAAASLVSLISFKLSEKPPDTKHPFGHARTEYVGTSVVALLILLLAYELGTTSVRQILEPVAVDYNALFVAALVISILVKIGLFIRYRRVARAIGSELLDATAKDSAGDVLASSAVLLGAGISRLTPLDLDPYLGILVALIIAYQGISVLKSTYDRLLGQEPDPELLETFSEKLLAYPEVLGIHDPVIHDYGPNRIFATVHVEVDAREDVLVSHELIDRMEREISRDMGVDLLIHMDPIVIDDPEVNARRTEISMLVSSIDARLSVHDFRLVKEGGSVRAFFDVTVPEDYTPSETVALRHRLAELIAKRHPTLEPVITLDRAYVTQHPREPG